MSLLHRYWFEFDFSGDGLQRYGYLPYPGCGVTAYDLEDAYHLLRAYVLRDEQLPKFKRVVEDFDVSTLETNHLLPNLGCTVWRGVWYPALNWYGPWPQ